MNDKHPKSREDKSKRKKSKHSKKSKKKKKNSSTSSSESDEWVEKESLKKPDAPTERDDWMAMTGMIKTYTRDDVKPKTDNKEKKHIDSYNPGTNIRELNPYWKDGGTGLPQSSQEFKKSRAFLKPTEHDNEGFYKKSYYTKEYKNPDTHNVYGKSNTSHDQIKEVYSYSSSNTSNWKKGSEKKEKRYREQYKDETLQKISQLPEKNTTSPKAPSEKYLSDEKMNKLAAKIVKAEIMGDMNLVNDLKSKLEAARQYRKDNPDAAQDDRVMLMATSSTGNCRPLNRSSQSGDISGKGRQLKVETHQSGQRTKYFGDDDKYSLNQMFEQEKYGNNYDDEAQLAKIAGKHKNPNDDLEDIFTDEISKNINTAKQDEREKQHAIREHRKVERSLEGCEYCLDSKSMLKHLIVSCGSKVYLALPSRKSLVKGQCIISTIQHTTCVTSLDEDIWEEVLNYRKALTQFFNSQNKDVVFFETATRLHKYPHMVIYCVPLPRDVGDTAPIYFKKAILECEAEWSMNKKVIDLKGKDIRKGVPKGLPYFWIDFGMDPGFAHIIEDQKLFPITFAQEIIGGILDLDHNLWKNPFKEYGDHQRRKVSEFVQQWKPFDTINKA